MSIRWMLDNKIAIVLVTAIVGGISYGGKLLNDTAYAKGIADERIKNLEKYEQLLKANSEKYDSSLKANNETLVELIRVRIHCKMCCPNGCETHP